MGSLYMQITTVSVVNFTWAVCRDVKTRSAYFSSFFIISESLFLIFRIWLISLSLPVVFFFWAFSFTLTFLMSLTAPLKESNAIFTPMSPYTESGLQCWLPFIALFPRFPHKNVNNRVLTVKLMSKGNEFVKDRCLYTCITELVIIVQKLEWAEWPSIDERYRKCSKCGR